MKVIVLSGLLLFCCFRANAGEKPCPVPGPHCPGGTYGGGVCLPCKGNSVSSGCNTRVCSICGAGTQANSSHTSCVAIVPTCQASVTNPVLAAYGAANPAIVISFLGYINNPDGSSWWPNGQNQLTGFTLSTCQSSWTWSADSTTGTWSGKPGTAVQCSYKLNAAQSTCGGGYTGHFTITCAGTSCTF
jgi:hypothetical protein